MPTPRDTVLRDGVARLYHFRRPDGVAAVEACPVLLVPSMINRWYVLDLRAGASVIEALGNAGLDVFSMDWGAPKDEDRYFAWDETIARLGRMLRRVRRITGAKKVTVLGYCMGATLTAIHASLEPEQYAGVINLLGPVDFTHSGILGQMTDKRWFDAKSLAAAGNISPLQMQSGFQAMRPTQTLGKMVNLADRAADPGTWESFSALEAWANDNVAFPAASYVTYIEDLYQGNNLIKGKHHVAGKRVDLAAITCPVLSVVADRDAICPPPAVLALNEAVGSSDKQVLRLKGGHVGAVVGSKAARDLYPALAAWMKART